MPMPGAVARFNRRFTNRVAGRFAGRVPPFAIVVHTGRRSGQTYRTPVMAFATPAGFVIALTYGPDADWVQNVLAAGGGGIEYRSAPIPLGDPRIVDGVEAGTHLPSVVRWALRLLRVDAFLVLRRADATG